MGSIFNIDGEYITLRITNEKFSISLIKAYSSNIMLSEFSEDTQELSRSSIPHLDTFRVSSDESIKDWVIQNTETVLVISKMMI